MSPQIQRLDAEHKNFTFRVVSVCVSSSAIVSFFDCATCHVDNQQKVLLDIQLVTFLEQACVE